MTIAAELVRHIKLIQTRQRKGRNGIEIGFSDWERLTALAAEYERRRDNAEREKQA